MAAVNAIAGECSATHCSGVNAINDGGGFGIFANATGSGGAAVAGDATGSATEAEIFAGNVDVNSGCLRVGGTTVGGTCASDQRLKTAIRPFALSLDKLAELQPVRFNWRDSNPPQYPSGGVRASGLIAQQVEKIFPNMVSTDARGFKQVNYSPLTFMMLEGVREHKARNDDLTFEVQAQGRQIRQANAQIRELARARAAKDAEMQSMNRQIEQLQKAQAQTMAVVARMDSRLRGNDKVRAARMVPRSSVSSGQARRGNDKTGGTSLARAVAPVRRRASAGRQDAAAGESRARSPGVSPVARHGQDAHATKGRKAARMEIARVRI
ncbi:MAG TPA: tail fiber domain-containing protein [Terriglobia bacterium]|nr:tail fiber domain-containing protein [Terriglobia bacterium]